MKPIRFAWCLAAAVFVLGCDQATEPTEQVDEITAPTFKAEHVDFIRESTWNDLIHYPCLNDGLGEVAWVRGLVTSYKGRVYSSSNNANRWTWSLEHSGLPEDHPYYFGPHFTLLGLESGDVWVREAHENPGESRRHDKKDGFVYKMLNNFWLVNQDGERLHVLDKLNLHCDYDWNCTQERVGGTCGREWIDYGPPDPLP
jgi:hypothetical protein